jgi:hypothetical protein
MKSGPITPADPAWSEHCAALTRAIQRAAFAYEGAASSPQLTAYVLISAAYAIAQAPTASVTDRQRIMRWCGEACMGLASTDGDEPVRSPASGFET